MSFVQNLLESIASEIGRPVSSVEPFIKTLENEWYDTKDALLGIDD